MSIYEEKKCIKVLLVGWLVRILYQFASAISSERKRKSDGLASTGLNFVYHVPRFLLSRAGKLRFVTLQSAENKTKCL